MKKTVKVIIESQNSYGEAKISIDDVWYEYKFPSGETLNWLRKKYRNNGNFLNQIRPYLCMN